MGPSAPLSGAPGAGERRKVTILFADLVGSTALAETMDPEDWSEVVHAAVEAMSRPVERYGGTITQFAGDAIMAVFGAPRAHEDDPARAVRAGREMVEEVSALAARLPGDVDRLEIRVGVHTGLAVVGEVGAGPLTEYTALGDTANVAARLQSMADPGKVLISSETLRLVGERLEVRTVGSVGLKGKSLPVEAFEVIRLAASPERIRGIPGLESPLVGRAEELERLVFASEAAAAGRGRVAVLVGEPGIGKSRLLRELRSRLEDASPGRWSLGRCQSFGQSFAYHLVASLVRSLLEVEESEGGREVRARVDRLGGGMAPESIHHLVHLLGLAGEGDPLDEASPDQLRRGYLSAVLDLVRLRTVDRAPLVLVCEDLHWSDPSSALLIADLVPACRDEPVLLVLTTRPERSGPGWEVVEAARDALGEAMIEISLRPLDEQDGRELVAHLLEVESLPEGLRGLVLDKAEGNPFFMEEIIRMLIERGVVERRDERWVATERVTEVEVPDTVQGLLAARIDALPPMARTTARVAAVIGRRFPLGLLEAVERDLLDGDGTGERLAALEGHGLVRLTGTRPEIEYGFRHALVQEVVYSSILRRERRRLHRVVGEAIERSRPEAVDELAPVLARHFEEAGDDAKAARYLLVSGRSALARFAVREAHDLFTRALGRAQGDDDRSRRTRVEAALGASRAGRTFVPTEQELAVLDAALPDAVELGDPSLEARIHMALVEARGFAGEWYETSRAYRESLDRAFHLADRVEDVALRASARGMMAGVRTRAGEYAEALRLLEPTVDQLAGVGHLAEASMRAGEIADILAILGRFDEAGEWGRVMSDLADRSGDPNARLDADLVLGKIEAERGNLTEAIEFTRRATQTADDVGNILCCLVGNFLLGDQQLRLGRTEDAIPFLQRGGELAEYCQAGSFMALGRAWLATARARTGQPGLEDFDEALETARSSGNRLGEAEVLRQRGAVRLLLPEPDHAAALADLEAAVAGFAALGARPSLVRALRDQAAVLELAGREEEAVGVLRRAEELAVEMGLGVETRG